jgi:hypothetical protein
VRGSPRRNARPATRGIDRDPDQRESDRRSCCSAGRNTGEVIGPGDYVYEPAGNIDSWEVIGDEPLVALVVVMGEVEDLAPDGSVRGRANAASRRREYADYCKARRIAMLDLDD